MPNEPDDFGTLGSGPGGPFEPGQILFGRYLAVRQLGAGGMGVVWLVRHRELEAERALKIITPGMSVTPEALGRFRREARVMARLSHPHAVIVHDAQVDRDVAFIEMEYIRGRSLDTLLRPGVPKPVDWVARIVVQLCSLLQAAHDSQVVHRDLKPSNLMLVEGHPPADPFLKVLDFGIAKILVAGDRLDVRTQTGVFIGTPPYTSPEQLLGESVDPRSDLYSTGVILYELISGQRPFTGVVTKVVYDHLHTPPPPFVQSGSRGGVPPEVERVILRCLAKNPDDRPQSARELAEEFLQAESRATPGAKFPASPVRRTPEPPITPSAVTRIITTEAMSSNGEPKERQDRSVSNRTGRRANGDAARAWRPPVILGLLLVASALAVAVVWIPRRHSGPPDVTPPAAPIERPPGDARPAGAESSPTSPPPGGATPTSLVEGARKPTALHRALVIGNDAYPKEARLESCVNDARAIASWLESEGYGPDEITLLTDARKRDIIGALQALAGECRRRRHEQVVVYFSGHGTTLPDDDGDEGPDDDTDEAFLAVFAPGDPWEEFVIRDDQFFLHVNAIADGTEQLVIAFDSCHAGGVFRGDLGDAPARKAKEIPERALGRMLADAGQSPGPFRAAGTGGAKQRALDGDGLPTEIRLPAAGPRLVMLASSNPFQVSRAGNPLSAFTEAFLAGVDRDRHTLVGPGGVLTLGGLRRYLVERLYSIPQTPVVLLRGIDEDGSFIPGLFPNPLPARQREQLLAVLESLLTLPPAARADGIELDVQTSRPQPLRVGTRFALKVRPGESGYLVVFTVSPGGGVSFLFPNRFRPNNAVEKGREATIPYADGMEIRPPVGEETYYVYLLEKNPFADFPFGLHGEALVVGQLEDVSRRLQARGRRIDADALRKALIRGRSIEPEAAPRPPQNPDPRGAWIRTQLTVLSVD